jgi:hypothetical protein
MIGVTRNVPTRGALDGPAAIEFEQVAAAALLARLGFGIGDAMILVANRPSPVIERPTRKMRDDIAPAKFEKRLYQRLAADSRFVIRHFANAGAVRADPSRGTRRIALVLRMQRRLRLWHRRRAGAAATHAA